jgi:hypothetical protein
LISPFTERALIPAGRLGAESVEGVADPLLELAPEEMLVSAACAVTAD